MLLKDFIIKGNQLGDEGLYILDKVLKHKYFYRIFNPFWLEVCKQGLSKSDIIMNYTPSANFIGGKDKNGDYFDFYSIYTYALDFSAVYLSSIIQSDGKREIEFKNISKNCYCNEKFGSGYGILMYIKYITIANDSHHETYISPIAFIPLEIFERYPELYKEFQEDLDLTKLNFVLKNEKVLVEPYKAETKKYLLSTYPTLLEKTKLDKYFEDKNWDGLYELYKS